MTSETTAIRATTAPVKATSLRSAPGNTRKSARSGAMNGGVSGRLVDFVSLTGLLTIFALGLAALAIAAPLAVAAFGVVGGGRAHGKRPRWRALSPA
ncbi:MAG: hypothetical protein AAFX08_08535 [Pseudomonadota bacterium]